ncbi:hypothetical protein NEHOM01_0074 [Nematocida homosporus]|uniref:uncharacterized protein n=1 Tax=Nematocida homosporus TaxID=1912981 RepID=UPI0022202440|nr:uncharacterized protein NEHOM01_0074 [Nematocida homosporus]KAI5184329.1 hypothetical protein NEHOM01_0074 [Nematocida homosporus]
MSKRSKNSLTNLILSFLIVLGLFKLSFQSMATNEQQKDHPNYIYTNLANGLQYLILVQPDSPHTQVSISVKKRSWDAGVRGNPSSHLLGALLRHKLQPRNNHQPYQEFLTRPNSHTITVSHNFITLEFFLNDPQCLIPFELLQSVITPQPTSDIIDQVKRHHFSNSQNNTSDLCPSTAEIAMEWAETFDFQNIRLVIVSPSQPIALLSFLYCHFHEHHRETLCQADKIPKMYSLNETASSHPTVNLPQLLIAPKTLHSSSSSEKTTITIIVPLLDRITPGTRPVLTDLYHLFFCCNIIYNNYLQAHPNNGLRIKAMPLTALETTLSLYITIEVDDTKTIEFTEALDLLSGFFQAIKASYKRPDSVLYQLYKTHLCPNPERVPNVLLCTLANLASVYMFFDTPTNLLNFAFEPVPDPNMISDLAGILETAMDREKWKVSAELTHVHWQQLPGPPRIAPIVASMLAATARVERIKDIICISEPDAQLGHAIAVLTNQQPSLAISNTSTEASPQLPNSISNPEQQQQPQRPLFGLLPNPADAFQQATSSALPANPPNANPSSIGTSQVLYHTHNELGLEACVVTDPQSQELATASVVLTSNDYLIDIKTYIWHVAHVLTVLESTKACLRQWIEDTDVFIDADIKENDKTIVIARGPETAIKGIFEAFFIIYKNTTINPTQEATALLKAYEFFSNAAIQTPPTLQQYLFARVWRLARYTPNECCRAILATNASFNSPIVTKALINIRVENTSLDIFHLIINTVTSYITPQPITKYQLVRNYDTEIYMSLETELMSAFVGYFHIDPIHTLDRTNYHILAYYLLLTQFSPKNLADHPNLVEIEYWLNAQTATPPLTSSTNPGHSIIKLNFDTEILKKFDHSINIFDETVIASFSLSGRYSPIAVFNSAMAYHKYLSWAIGTCTPELFELYKQQVQLTFSIVNSINQPFTKITLLFSCDDFWKEPCYQKKFTNVLQNITLEDFRFFFLNYCKVPLIVIYPDAYQPS